MTDILIVVDMQRDFVTGALGTPEAVSIVPAVAARIRRAREEGTRILLTLDTHEADYLTTREGRYLPVPHCIRDTEGWALVPEVAAECGRGMMSFEKPTFGSTALAHHVAALAAEQGAVEGRGMRIELCGVCTDICVVSNALLIKAFCPEAEVCVRAGCCAGVTPQSHQTALAAMRACQVKIL